MDEMPTERMSRRLLESKVGRSSLPRYRRVNERSYKAGSRRSTVYAFHMKNAPHWIVIGKGWVSNMSDLDFIANYDPSNAEAREMIEKALGRTAPEVRDLYKARRR